MSIVLKLFIVPLNLLNDPFQIAFEPQQPFIKATCCNFQNVVSSPAQSIAKITKCCGLYLFVLQYNTMVLQTIDHCQSSFHGLLSDSEDWFFVIPTCYRRAMRNIHTFALIMGHLVQIYNVLAYRRAMRNTCSHNGTPCPKFAFSVLFFNHFLC